MLSAIIIALIFGVWSLVQTKNIQKAERKQRLLNEIMDWARDLLMCGSEMFTQPTPEISPTTRMVHGISSLYLRYRATNAKSKYVEKIASDFRQNLLQDVLSVTSKLKELIILLEDSIGNLKSGKSISISTHKKTSECEVELYDLIRSLIEKIAKIKLK